METIVKKKKEILTHLTLEVRTFQGKRQNVYTDA